jgi:hypothetical protein
MAGGGLERPLVARVGIDHVQISIARTGALQVIEDHIPAIWRQRRVLWEPHAEPADGTNAAVADRNQREHIAAVEAKACQDQRSVA